MYRQSTAGEIVNTCGWVVAMRHGFGGSFDQLAVDEGGAGADQGDQVGCVDRAPAVLGGLDEFERHGQPGGAAARPLGDRGSMPHGSEGRLVNPYRVRDA